MFGLHVDLVLVLFTYNPVHMIDVVFVDIFDAEIVDYERARDVSGLVAEKAFGVFGFDVVVFCQMGDKVVVSYAS